MLWKFYIFNDLLDKEEGRAANVQAEVPVQTSIASKLARTQRTLDWRAIDLTN